MGYRPGEGLGKEGQGITAPVEAVKRKGRAAIGAYVSDRRDLPHKSIPVVDSENEEDKIFQEELHNWKKHSEV